MSARKEFGGVITFIVHPDFIRDNRFYPVIPKTIQMVINEAATRPEKLYFIDQDTSAPGTPHRRRLRLQWESTHSRHTGENPDHDLAHPQHRYRQRGRSAPRRRGPHVDSHGDFGRAQ